MFSSPFFRKYLLPGFVFQSITIAGGYGTGRELVEFFLNYGPIGGLIAMWLVATVIWCAVSAATFELARAGRAYDYRQFTRQLLGRAWGLYEACYLAMMLLVLAVIAAAAGSILEEVFELPYLLGVVGMMAAVGVLAFMGSAVIEAVFAVWSFVLYAVYLVFFASAWLGFGSEIGARLAGGEVLPGWLLAGVKYAAYNIGMVPAVLFSLRHIETRKEAIGAGLLAGPIAMMPGFLFYLAMVGHYPEISQATVPATFLLAKIGSSWLLYAFQIVLFGTLVETGTGLIHAFNERLAGAFRERTKLMPEWTRPLVAITALVAASGLAQAGLTDLIARGYGTITWGFLLIYVVPVLGRGAWKLFGEAQK